MTAGLDFGPIRDDDELLDRLGDRRRGSHGDRDDLEDMLAAWTARIDADEQEYAENVGPLGLRRVPGTVDDAPSRLTVVQVRRARAVAVLGALALTVSGGGVAAALTQHEFGPVRTVAAKAAEAAAIVRGDVPTATQSPSAVSAAAVPQVVESIRHAVDTGDVQKAKGMLEVFRSLAPKDAASPEITQQVEELAKKIDAADPTIVAAPSVDKEVTATTASTGRPTGVPSSTVAPSITTAPLTTAPTAERTPSKTGATTAEGTPQKTPDATVGPSAPTQAAPATPTPPAPLGSAGGGQTAGTGSPSTSVGTLEAREPTGVVEKGSDVAPGDGTDKATHDGSGAGGSTSGERSEKSGDAAAVEVRETAGGADAATAAR
ncbi:hypothetical protein [Mobilicoccus pelagius]|uniref:Uncharacterized protein n=1 Tax=Mobilicoccus pelagius NBRC 104925 TaxID=1089455 RepID=H5UU91_9MICO|nr:hypothetical protein [Mobilicoccus pelagius]GAB49299.1 hypothetical protein MOPEL_099_00990 [Mobilicoccus pelagius NBRC 104925]